MRPALQLPADATPQAVPTAAPELDYAGACQLPMPWGNFELHGFVDVASGKEHLAITLGDLSGPEPLLMRIHSECLTGDALFSQRCDCGAQLEAALQRIAAAGRGVVLYLRQEGRGIGLINKIRAYQLQDAGADTVEANEALGFAADLRRYELCRPMLETLGVQAPLRLLTNNPKKLAAMKACGLDIHEREALVAGRNPYNARYLATKRQRLGHLLAA